MPAPKGHPPYPGCETGGRPKKYTKEFIEKEADAFMEWLNTPGSMYFKRFALNRGYNPLLLSAWAKENEKFRIVHQYAQQWQETRLAEGGLTSEFNSGFCKFVMGNVCKWTEKTEVSGSQKNPLSFVLQKADGKSTELVSTEDE